VSEAKSTIHSDDDRVRVTTWTFGDGDSTGHHVHEHDYLVVPVTGGTFEIIAADRTIIERIQHAGVPYTGTAGTAHDVINRSGRVAEFVEIELR
jgi:hypothetical protein